MRCALIWVSAQRRLAVSARLFKMGRIGCPGTSVRHYHPTLCKIAQDRRPQALIVITLEMGLYVT